MTAEKKIKIDMENDDSRSDEEPSAAPTKREDRQASDPVETEAGTPQTGETVRELERKLEDATGEARENYDRLLRVSAEFENYKKRMNREMDDLRKFAIQSLVKDLLPIIDNLELALKSASDHLDEGGNRLRDGVALTHKEILKTLDRYNVTQIDALGQPFDPNFHEAVMREEDEEHPPNTIINELQKGYLLHDRLIRPSMVVVSMSKQGSDDTGEA
ncbi:MAG TPA: nucleotide exchange factor GrpE [Desulfobacterales bacterium]